MECDTDRVALAALDHSLRLRSLTEEANRGNITFYSIDPRVPLEATTGGEKPAGRGRDTTNAASRQDSLRFIADNTDGVWSAAVTPTRRSRGSSRTCPRDLPDDLYRPIPSWTDGSGQSPSA